MYTDRTGVRTSKIVSRYLSLLKDEHEFVTSSIQSNKNSDVNNDNKLSKEKFTKIEEEYDKLAHQRGAIIRVVVRIERAEESRSLFEDADFSDETIKKSIMQGERDAEKALVKNSGLLP